MKIYPKIYIGPMSKNIVDAAIALSKAYPVGLIPSRRQVDYAGGYVNHWTTEQLYEYVPSDMVIERDHGGPMQGAEEDDGSVSLSHDAMFCNIIHIDPWKAYNDYKEGIKSTVDLINLCYNCNPFVEFEVGTEEAIRSFTQTEYNSLLQWLKYDLGRSAWGQIKYVVVQSGTGLDVPNRKNTGIFDPDRLKAQIALLKYRKIKSKEHNGDYLSAKDIGARFRLGLDAINIAPEIGQYETQAIWEAATPDFREYFYQKCIQNITKFNKWLPEKFDMDDQHALVLTGGHYCLADLENPPDVHEEVKDRLKHRLESIYATQ